MVHPALKLTAFAALALGLAAPARAATLPVVAAERVYGAMVAEIAGPAASVRSILANPAQDPHLFEADPATARAVAAARLVIVNGAGYDPWMDRLLAADPVAGRIVINVATLSGATARTNPHLWYAPATMHRVASAVTEALSRLDPDDAPAFAAAGARMQARLGALDTRIAGLRARFGGQPIAATEPVFDPMAAALGLDMRDASYQLAAMNGTEPSASAVAAIEDDVRERRVRVLLVNAQVSNDSTRRLLAIAEDASVPAIGVTETEPAGVDYTTWMLAELDCVQAALEVSTP